MPELLLTERGTLTQGAGGFPEKNERKRMEENEKKRLELLTKEAPTYWGVNNGLLKNLVVLQNRINGTIRATQLQRTLEGNLRSTFVASRRITIEDKEIMEKIKPLLVDKTEFPVNVAGVFTSTPKETQDPKTGQKVTNWYDNYIITELKVLQ